MRTCRPESVPRLMRGDRRSVGGSGGARARVVENKIEAAYARSDLLERRREVMREWSCYIRGQSQDAGNMQGPP